MPYIPHNRREFYDKQIVGLLDSLHLASQERLSDLAYIITKLVLYSHPYERRWQQWAETLAILESVKLELYRRFIGPYEDEAIERNGDL